MMYLVSGPVRGRISTHRRLSAAVKSLMRDQRACGSLGGGSYSDARVLAQGIYPVPVGTYQGQWSLGEWDDHTPDAIREAVEAEARS